MLDMRGKIVYDGVAVSTQSHSRPIIVSQPRGAGDVWKQNRRQASGFSVCGGNPMLDDINESMSEIDLADYAQGLADGATSDDPKPKATQAGLTKLLLEMIDFQQRLLSVNGKLVETLTELRDYLARSREERTDGS
ncbi:hypothetical protein LCGC14_0785900 [marine sediment metagenome]|uniref:Uncharacterized protein n=1 Tax=marine sediment metagenome TaxID=412755 RepID=A0A0F9T144_9ZZZZ